MVPNGIATVVVARPAVSVPSGNEGDCSRRGLSRAGFKLRWGGTGRVARVKRPPVDAWNVFAYVIRNPRDAGIPVPQRGMDRGLVVSTAAILGDRFLQAFFGIDAARFLALLTWMQLKRMAYEPLWQDTHPQLALGAGRRG